MLGTQAHPVNATKVAGALDGQPPVEPVSCPRYGGAAEQILLPGGMPSSPVEGDRGRALAVRVSTRAANYKAHRTTGCCIGCGSAPQPRGNLTNPALYGVFGTSNPFLHVRF